MKLELNVKKFNNEDVIATSGASHYSQKTVTVTSGGTFWSNYYVTGLDVGEKINLVSTTGTVSCKVGAGGKLLDMDFGYELSDQDGCDSLGITCTNEKYCLDSAADDVYDICTHE